MVFKVDCDEADLVWVTTAAEVDVAADSMTVSVEGPGCDVAEIVETT